MESRNRTIGNDNKSIVVGYLYNVRSFMTYVYIFAMINVIIGFFLILLGGPKLYAKICVISGVLLIFVIPLIINNYKVNGKILFCKEKIDLIYDDGNKKSYKLENLENIVIDYSNYWSQSEFSMVFPGFHINNGTENFVSFNYEGKREEIMFQVRNRQFIRDIYDLWKHRDSPSIKLIHDKNPPVVKWTNK
ncbi:MAG: hypothetical protein ACOCQ4_02345 [bacterium]